MVCHPHRLDFKAILDEGKIFLANLNSDETRSEQANLGAMLITDFQMAAMTRRADENAAIAPFYLFVEEVQQFVTNGAYIILNVHYSKWRNGHNSSRIHIAGNYLISKCYLFRLPDSAEMLIADLHAQG
jgi:hypothetical protein